MNRSSSIQALISKSKKSFISLKTDYDASLQDQTISEELKIKFYDEVKQKYEHLFAGIEYNLI